MKSAALTIRDSAAMLLQLMDVDNRRIIAEKGNQQIQARWQRQQASQKPFLLP